MSSHSTVAQAATYLGSAFSLMSLSVVAGTGLPPTSGATRKYHDISLTHSDVAL